MDAASIAATLQKQGQPMTLTKAEMVSYDPVTGGTIKPSYVQEHTVYGVTSNYNGKDDGSAASATGTMILAGDKKATIQAGVDEFGDEVIPAPGDKLTVMGAEWSVVAVNSVNPQGVNLLHICQIRK